jgi:thioredoxin reductase
MYDTLIVGGGIAGMSAALILARCRRKVAIFDSGMPRNRFTTHMNGYLSRDGIKPLDFVNIGLKELRKYDVDWVQTEITNASRYEDNFWVQDSKNKWYGRKMLLATGLKDNVPDVEGFDRFYGTTIHHCPICDGWESRDQKIIVYGHGKSGFSLALQLINWSRDITLCTDGAPRLSAEQREILKERNIAIITNKITAFEGQKAQLERVAFKDREPESCQRLYFTGGYVQQCDLAYRMGCETRKNGKEFWVSRLQMSSIEGLYISGDAAFDMKMAIVAAAEGAKAGVAINLALMEAEGLRIP